MSERPSRVILVVLGPLIAIAALVGAYLLQSKPSEAERAPSSGPRCDGPVGDQSPGDGGQAVRAGRRPMRMIIDR
jgi:hypothetical protein